MARVARKQRFVQSRARGRAPELSDVVLGIGEGCRGSHRGAALCARVVDTAKTGDADEPPPERPRGDVAPHVGAEAVLEAVEQHGQEEVSLAEVEEAPKTETVAELRTRRLRIREADQAARASLREQFLQHWHGRPEQETITLHELRELANEWLQAPPLDTSGGAALERPNPTLVRTLWFCCKRCGAAMRASVSGCARSCSRCPTGTGASFSSGRSACSARGVAARGGRASPFVRRMLADPVQEWAASLPPKSRYKAVSLLTPFQEQQQRLAAAVKERSARRWRAPPPQRSAPQPTAVAAPAPGEASPTKAQMARLQQRLQRRLAVPSPPPWAAARRLGAASAEHHFPLLRSL